MELYNKVRQLPKEAIKEIGAGRVKGKSGINPMWRIKTSTGEIIECIKVEKKPDTFVVEVD